MHKPRLMLSGRNLKLKGDKMDETDIQIDDDGVVTTAQGHYIGRLASESERKIIQLATSVSHKPNDHCHEDYDEVRMVVALCDDGSSWVMKLSYIGDSKWERLPDIPQRNKRNG